MAKEKKIVGKSSKTKKYNGPRYIRKEGTRFDTQNLPWGVELTREGTIQFRIKGKLANYSKWKIANKEHWKEVARDKVVQKKNDEAAALRASIAAEQENQRKIAEAAQKVADKEAARLSKIAEKEAKKQKPHVKTWQEETDEWRATRPDPVISIPKQEQKSRTLAGSSVSIPSKNSTDNKPSYQPPPSELQILRATLVKELTIVKQNILVGQNIYNRIVGNKAYEGIPKRIETFIKRSDRLVDSITNFLKRTTWTSWNMDYENIKNKCIEYTKRTLSVTRDLDFLVGNVTRIDEKLNQGDELNQEIEKELSEIDKLSEDAIDQLQRRKEADQKHFPEKFKRQRSTVDSTGFADALGMGFENESKFFKKLFSPFTSHAEEKKIEKRDKLYHDLGISDEDLENNPLFEGVNPATASTKDYSVKEKINKNAERMKKSKEKELRKRGVNPSTVSTTNNNVGGSTLNTTANNSNSNSSNISSNNSQSNDSKNSNIFSRTAFKTTNFFKEVKSEFTDALNSPTTVNNATTPHGLDFNRSDDSENIVEEQKKTNVILEKILKKDENLRGGGLLSGALSSLLPEALLLLPFLKRKKTIPTPIPNQTPKPGGGSSKTPEKPSTTPDRLNPKGEAPKTPKPNKPGGFRTMGGLGRLLMGGLGGVLTMPSTLGDGTVTGQNERLRRMIDLGGPSAPNALKSQGQTKNYWNQNTTGNVKGYWNKNSTKQMNPINAVDSNKVQNIYNNGKGTEVDFSPHETFMIKSFVPALSKAIASELSSKNGISSTEFPKINLMG